MRRPVSVVLRLACAVGALVILVVTRPAFAGDAAVTCQTYVQSGTVPASYVADGIPLPYSIMGELCARPSDLRDGGTVQLLIHGATYNHGYWDFGVFNGVRYSYARGVAAAGFPTFAFDQIGTGQSSKPPSAILSDDVATFVAHEALRGLRDGSLAGTRFGKVIVVGHSLGVLAALRMAANYQDVDGVIVTGGATRSSPSRALLEYEASGGVIPAIVDPKFANSGLDPGYLTTKPGTRGFFYNLAFADPAVVAADDNAFPFEQQTFGSEIGKDVLAGGQVMGSEVARSSIRVPVLVIIGREDASQCGPDLEGEVVYDCSSGDAIAEQEKGYYAPEAQVQGCSVPGSGHAIALHLNNWVEEDAAINWSRRYVGRHGKPEGSGRLPSECGFSHD